MPGRSIRTPFSGQRLADQRELLGLTQADLAALTDHTITRDQIANWETGRSKPPARSLPVLVQALASAIGIDDEAALALLLDEEVAA